MTFSSPFEISGRHRLNTYFTKKTFRQAAKTLQRQTNQGKRNAEKLAEAHGNRTHLTEYQSVTPDLKSGRATSALSASEGMNKIITVDLKNNFLL